ncbi:MAG: sulfatase [Planctomycetes bacterium]|nr:sulfatase [Planctomycetota bacterium]
MPTEARPNVVVFLVDDLGWQDLSEPFAAERTDWNRRYRTPNVERLSRQGTKFTQACAHPVCTPTRVSLLTGMAAARHRATHWTLRKDTPTDRPIAGFTMPAWNVNGLSSDPTTPRAVHAETLPQRLREVGYRTILVGKAHFGAIGTPGADPQNLGFDVNVAGHAAGAPSSYLASKNFLRAPNDTIWQVPGLDAWHGKDAFLTDVLTTEAIAAAAAARTDGQPFLLYLSHYAVHTPLDADERYAPAYRAAGLPEAEARYAALIEGMDASLGRVLDWLDGEGLANDTIVLFLSDNGGLSASARGGEKHRHNAPLRSGKGSCYEGGVRIPFAARWPGRFPAGAVQTLPVQVEDLFPTICELTGARPQCPDGHSFVRALRGEEQPAHPLFWHHPHQWGSNGPGIEPYSAVRDGDWKLIWFWLDGRAELYHLGRDLGETVDCVTTEPAVAARLCELLRAQLAGCAAQLPYRTGAAPLIPH